jgi:hypothetical protein
VYADELLKSKGWKPTNADQCVYTRGVELDGEEYTSYFILYVDDFLLWERNEQQVLKFKDELAPHLITCCFSGCDTQRSAENAC